MNFDEIHALEDEIRARSIKNFKEMKDEMAKALAVMEEDTPRRARLRYTIS